jgi:hypothetical protein
VSLHKLIESRIQDALAAGAFDGLAGAGRPFRFDESDQLAGDNWMGFRVLKNGGMLPAWLLLARDIERDRDNLEGLAARHGEWVAIAASSGDWRRHAPAITRLRARFIAAARELRKKQDRFNIDAPSIALERPALWVEYHVEKLDNALREAGAPPALFPWIEEGADPAAFDP